MPGPGRAARRRGRPRLIVMAGLPGTGKSTLARHLVAGLDAVWLRVDTIEAALVEAGLTRSFETGLAVYLAARDIAREHLRLPRDAVIDAVNGVEPARRMWRELAEECAARRFVIEVVCSDPSAHRRRVESRLPPTPPLPSPTWEEVVRREYEPWNEPILTVDGVRPPGENLARIRKYLRAGRGDRAPGPPRKGGAVAQRTSP